MFFKSPLAQIQCLFLLLDYFGVSDHVLLDGLFKSCLMGMVASELHDFVVRPCVEAVHSLCVSLIIALFNCGSGRLAFFRYILSAWSLRLRSMISVFSTRIFLKAVELLDDLPSLW